MEFEMLNGKPVACDPLGDGISSLELIGYTNLIDGSQYNVDQFVLLAARVSKLLEGKTGQNRDKDIHLMSDTLAQNKHMTPFQHVAINFRVVAPIMVFREWHRHRMQNYNEMSMRYIRAEDQESKIFRFYRPRAWRLQSKNNKQGSEGSIHNIVQSYCDEQVESVYHNAKTAYMKLAEHGVASELCRIVLPVSTYSEMYASAWMRNWYEFYELRASEDAQWEIRQYALAIGQILNAWFPDSWGALSKWKTVGLSNEELDAIINDIKEGAKLSALTPFGENLVKKLEKIRRRA
jgi:thymidylate synthase (FAD)